MMRPEGHLISAVAAGSIAADLGLAPGDYLLLIDGSAVVDIFDYHMRQQEEQLLLTVRRQDSVIEYEIEKDEAEDLGLSFANPLMQDCLECDNNCVFCFIDQLPPGLRSSLYVKDDDLRLSFLTGNYATLTNLTDQELERLIQLRFSPLNISVHTTDPQLRKKMLRNKKAGDVLQRLQKIAAAGLEINCQIVLCPELNDGDQLDKTLADLAGLGPQLASVAVVPVGLTRHRTANRLFPLRPFSQAEAARLLDQIDAHQTGFLACQGRRLVYAADEFYLLAGRPLPAAAYYEGYPQLENGVGMMTNFIAELEEGLTGAKPAPAWSGHLVLGTGTAAVAMFTPFLAQLARLAGCPVTVWPVENEFFGKTVTVAGLVTGQDIKKQLAEPLTQLKQAGQVPLLLLPDSMFKADAEIMLDDITREELVRALDVPVIIVAASGTELVRQLVLIGQGQGEIK